MKTLMAPMGWNSWDCYGAAVTEDIVRKNAEYMAKNLKQYGWEYIVVDIQWYEPAAVNHEYHPFTELCMDEYGRLLPAENRFPSAKGGRLCTTCGICSFIRVKIRNTYYARHSQTGSAWGLQNSGNEQNGKAGCQDRQYL